MNEENREFVSKSGQTQPRPHSIEELLRHLDPEPDDETERFVAAIYEDRRRFAPALP
jgi:hypothetical protein